ACTIGHVELLTSSAMLPEDCNPRGGFNLSIIAQIPPFRLLRVSCFGGRLKLLISSNPGATFLALEHFVFLYIRVVLALPVSGNIFVSAVGTSPGVFREHG